MRNTVVFAVLLAAGCFNPRITDQGFGCDPTASQPCPDGMYCRNFSGAFLCTTNQFAPTGLGDMAMSSGGGGGGGGGGTGGDVDLATPSGPVDMATLPPDLTPPSTSCKPTDLVINEVRTGSSASAKEEWVELYNPCGNAITFSGKLIYRSDTSTTDTSTLATIPSTTIAGGGYYLIANSGYSGSPAADIATFSSTSVGMADGGGGVALRDNSNNILCSMGWGTANNGFQQGSAAPTEGSGKSIARTPNGANTKHDSVDFKSATPTPRAAN